MIRHVFLTKPECVSTRWLQAFPEATIVYSERMLPKPLDNYLVWVLLEDPAILNEVTQLSLAGVPVVVMSLTDSPTEAKIAIEAGARGYVHYLAVVPVLEQIAQVIALGGLWLGADLVRQLVASTTNLLPSKPEPINLKGLTLRERSVAIAVAAGKTNKEVARELGITERTVKAHLSVVFEKLQVRDRLQLALEISRSS